MTSSRRAAGGPGPVRPGGPDTVAGVPARGDRDTLAVPPSYGDTLATARSYGDSLAVPPGDRDALAARSSYPDALAAPAAYADALAAPAAYADALAAPAAYADALAAPSAYGDALAATTAAGADPLVGYADATLLSTPGTADRAVPTRAADRRRPTPDPRRPAARPTSRPVRQPDPRSADQPGYADPRDADRPGSGRPGYADPRPPGQPGGGQPGGTARPAPPGYADQPGYPDRQGPPGYADRPDHGRLPAPGSGPRPGPPGAPGGGRARPDWAAPRGPVAPRVPRPGAGAPRPAGRPGNQAVTWEDLLRSGRGPGAEPPRGAPTGTVPWRGRPGSGWDGFFTGTGGPARPGQQPMSGADVARVVADVFRRNLRGGR